MLKHAKLVVGSLLLAFSVMPAQAQAAGIQCAPFARMFSGIKLFGDAYTWWSQAIGKYTRGSAPAEGAVLVFKAARAMRVGHVATVTKVISDRIIKVTHANWTHGRVENDVTVEDASAAGDWSKVKVWYAPINGMGIRAYPVFGFIYGGKVAAAAIRSVADASADAATDASTGS